MPLKSYRQIMAVSFATQKRLTVHITLIHFVLNIIYITKQSDLRPHGIMER